MTSFLINPYRFASAAYDTDAQAYITAVEGPSGDNQALETGVKDAINAFVVGCKADGIWTAIKACCILAGARTLAGALQPLVGTAPTNVGGLFVSGDYNRETGLIGNGSSKYLNSNYAITSSLASNNHIGIWLSATPTIASVQFGVAPAAISGLIDAYRDTSNSVVYYSNYSTTNYLGPSVANSALCGVSRSASASFVARSNNTSSTIAQAVVASPPASQTPYIFCRSSNGTPQYHSNARIAFYSIGESLDLSLLDSRVSTLLTAIAAAIP